MLLRECKGGGEYELLTGGTGATFAPHRFQEIMSIDKARKVVVFVSSYEHNTNYLTWLVLGAKVIIAETDINSNMDLNFIEDRRCWKKGRKYNHP